MLFNSYVFLLGFLPVCALGFRAAERAGGRELALLWLLGCSLFFYGWWNPPYVLLLLGTIAVNFALGCALRVAPPHTRSWLLTGGIALNLGLLGYFKYAEFFARSEAALLGRSGAGWDVVLPLGISFFTFQQIAYLVDTRRGRLPAHAPLHYALVVSFFPHLIAGPIVRASELLPQFQELQPGRRRSEDACVGLAVLVAGLCKKVLLADHLAQYANGTFAAAARGMEPAFAEAWVAALAYALQLYFDFSGYSDMAIGLARLFGVRLPANFDSPYKAQSIAEFWRRWHITLSRFLRDYLYVPLGGSRRGPLRRALNLLLTMLLGGLWHGAEWTFVAWGGVHGALLILNHGWRALRQRLGWSAARAGSWRWAGSRALTFLCVVLAWVLFRAESFPAAARMLAGMAGGSGFEISSWLELGNALRLIAPLLIVVWFAPNSQQIFDAHLRDPEASGALRRLRSETWCWRPSPLAAGGLAALAVVVLLGLSGAHEFLYYHF